MCLTDWFSNERTNVCFIIAWIVNIDIGRFAQKNETTDTNQANYGEYDIGHRYDTLFNNTIIIRFEIGENEYISPK